MINYKLFKRMIKITTLVISPFITLTIFTPLTNIPLYINISCIIIAILVSVFITYRSNSKDAVIQFRNKALFLSELDTQLRLTGYVAANHNGNIIRYCGTFQTSLLAEDIIVRTLNGKALITAPKNYLKKILNGLQLTNIHLVEHELVLNQNEYACQPCLQFHHRPAQQSIKLKRLV